MSIAKALVAAKAKISVELPVLVMGLINFAKDRLKWTGSIFEVAALLF